MQNVTTHWYQQTIDHFSWAPTPTGETHFPQRYLVHRGFRRPGGPIFFYCGNEANVELYVNATGLMWENAEDFGAALVFAEHRYYGESKPFGKAMTQHLHYLTMEQALADYAELLAQLRSAWGASESAVIAFGGSYGGMLAAWLRMKYPGSVDGSIAASAPVLAFQGVGSFGDGQAFWQVVTRDASPEAGSAEECAPRVRRAWDELFRLGEAEDGRAELGEIFRLCGKQAVKTRQDVTRLALMQLNAWDTMAMGNFPYPSNYLVYQQTQDPAVKLPAFPVRVACEHMSRSGAAESPRSLLAALRDAAGVLYNASGVACYDLPEDPNFDGIWDYQWCTEMLPQETYFARDGKQDMFWASPMDMTSIRRHCNETFGVEPRPQWIATEFAGTAGATNVVFSNGLLDPWSSGGVLRNISESVVAVVIPEGAHHLDLMFSNPADPESVKHARRVEMAHVRRWISEKAAGKPGALGYVHI